MSEYLVAFTARIATPGDHCDVIRMVTHALRHSISPDWARSLGLTFGPVSAASVEVVGPVEAKAIAAPES